MTDEAWRNHPTATEGTLVMYMCDTWGLTGPLTSKMKEMTPYWWVDRDFWERPVVCCKVLTGGHVHTRRVIVFGDEHIRMNGMNLQKWILWKTGEMGREILEAINTWRNLNPKEKV